ncbi:MAG: hypothetical protein JWN50_738 [Parcubacteria group bacterium]|nr:hypothetical protein [Parcubacteria group bacterium]
MLTDTTSLETLASAHPIFVLTLVAWSFAWKGVALWKSAELRQKKWFIAILIVNLFGLVEIVYLFFVARKYKVEVIEV